MPKLVFLWTDIVAAGCCSPALLGYVWRVRAQRRRCAPTWRKVFRDPPALCSAIVLGVFLLRRRCSTASTSGARCRRARRGGRGARPTTRAPSRCSTCCSPRWSRAREIDLFGAARLRAASRRNRSRVDGQTVRELPAAAVRRRAPEGPDARMGAATSRGARSPASPAARCWRVARRAASRRVVRAARRQRPSARWRAHRAPTDTDVPCARGADDRASVLLLVAGVAVALAGRYHVFGTDRTGNDVLYQALKSVRTAFVIGTLATLATLPLAIVLGILAGYFKGWVDEVIQYLYTVLSSVPERAADRRLRADGAGVHRQASRDVRDRRRARRPAAVPALRDPRR